MARGSIFSFTVFLLATASGFGQIMIPGVGGGGYPGGGYPGGGYPGQGVPIGRRGNNRNNPNNPNNSNNSQTTLVGVLRSLNSNNVVIESDDNVITTIQVPGSTKYISETGGKAQIGDFQPGDRVSVDANQDNNQNYRAKTMTMIREGSPEEHAKASEPVDTSRSASSGGGSSNTSASRNTSSSVDDPDRPVLRRAGSSSDSSTSGGSSTASSSSSSSRSSSSDSSDDDRPRMRRAASSDGTTSAQITPVAPPQREASASRDTPAPRDPDDPGPPELRRGRPAATTARSSSSENPVAADSRPSLHADDVNGVTRMPSAPDVAAPGDIVRQTSGNMRMPSSGDEFIDQTREAAFSFTETLPNYVVKQYTTRYGSVIARGGKTSWQALDNVTADVIEENGEERYKNIQINGKPAREDPEKTGSWSRGEFSSLQLDVLSPLTNADFHGKRTTTIVSRASIRYDFSVEQKNSHWHVEAEGQSYLPAYTGTIWIDKENNRVLRIELQAQGMPRSFPLDQVESAVDYDYVFIGESKFLLPVHSEALSCARASSQCSRNVIEFRNYKKFTADTSITFDDH
ncbi:MAG TPA: hypothetical protein VG273_19230 [Bryobacteraceae bacterium]|jgi:hypothetical protein|nr:hypothetical protein [Bryobacteraceae bacterium]